MHINEPPRRESEENLVLKNISSGRGKMTLALSILLLSVIQAQRTKPMLNIALKLLRESLH